MLGTVMAGNGSKPPNIILIMADDLGWTDIACKGQGSEYDSTLYETPNLAKLRAEGMRFTQAYACPKCQATRLGILTGKNFARFANINAPLPFSETTIPEALDKDGLNYISAFAGKWQISGGQNIKPHPSHYYPDKHGFDYNYGGNWAGIGAVGGSSFNNRAYWEPDKNFSKKPGWYQEDPVAGGLYFPCLGDTDPGNPNEFITDALTTKAIQFMESTADPGSKNYEKPFFLYLPYYAPHRPAPTDLDEIAYNNYFHNKADVLPVAQWKMDEIKGKAQRVTFDYFGRNEGVLRNFKANKNPWVQGRFIRALKFDGRDDHMEIVGYKGIAGNSSRTVSAWIKTDSKKGTIISWGDDRDGRLWSVDIARVWYKGCLRVTVGDGYVYGSTNISDGNWHHIAAVLDDGGLPDVSNVRLYVDGMQEKNGKVESQRINTSVDNNVIVGARKSGNYFKGLIDEVSIYEVELSAERIRKLANCLLQDDVHYAALIKKMDDNIGRILNAVQKLPYPDNTIIIFYSDNGGDLGITSNYPLKGGKLDLYEGGVRVPLIVRWPGVVKPNSTCHEAVCYADFFPTFLEIAHGKFDPKAFPDIDGVSIQPLLRDGCADIDRAGGPDDFLYFSYKGYSILATDGAYKGYKLIKRKGNSDYELYYLPNDIGETNNIYTTDTKNPQGFVSTYLKTKLGNWTKSLKSDNCTDHD